MAVFSLGFCYHIYLLASVKQNSSFGIHSQATQGIKADALLLAIAPHKYGYTSKTHHYRLYHRLSICLAAPTDTVCHAELYTGTLCLGDTVFPQREPNKINYTSMLQDIKCMIIYESFIIVLYCNYVRAIF